MRRRSTTRATTTFAVPNDMSVRSLIPWLRTSHGLSPSPDSSCSTIPSANRKRPATSAIRAWLDHRGSEADGSGLSPADALRARLAAPHARYGAHGSDPYVPDQRHDGGQSEQGA